jgi:hypothetical protein
MNILFVEERIHEKKRKTRKINMTRAVCYGQQQASSNVWKSNFHSVCWCLRLQLGITIDLSWGCWHTLNNLISSHQHSFKVRRTKICIIAEREEIYADKMNWIMLKLRNHLTEYLGGYGIH